MATLIAGVVLVAVGAVGALAITRTQDRLGATAEQATGLAAQIQGECRSGALAGPICQEAAQVVAEPVPQVVRGERGPGPTDAQIADAVARYLARNPPPTGRPPTTGEITAAVAEYLMAHPPQPGRPPTAEEIAAAVGAYLQANPPPEGQPGRAPTEGEIQAAVDAYLAAHPPLKGDKGDPGPACPPGTHLESVQFGTLGPTGVGCVDDDDQGDP